MTSRTVFLIAMMLVEGFFLGLLVSELSQQFSHVSYDSAISLLDGIDILLTVAIGVFIPVYVVKSLENNKSIKAFLIDEVKALKDLVLEISNNIESLNHNTTISTENKRNLLRITHSINLQIDSIFEQHDLSFRRNRGNVAEVQSAYFEYFEFLTGGKLMNNNFVLDFSFISENRIQQQVFKNHINKLIHDIYNY